MAAPRWWIAAGLLAGGSFLLGWLWARFQQEPEFACADDLDIGLPDGCPMKRDAGEPVAAE